MVMLSLNRYQRIAHVFMVVVIVMSVLAIETPMQALARHRNVGEGECSWFPDRVPHIYDFHAACTNYDACGERAGRNKLAWDHCDKQLKVDTEN
jgi:hypothetical protein